MGEFYELDVYKGQGGRKSQLSKIRVRMPLEAGGIPAK